ncbi:MAG TPA: hypothetical protein VMM56_17445 [Planctomycetaceae bacterium]|nr:hypothetical protein [Planctomycetaceae bacterium]
MSLNSETIFPLRLSDFEYYMYSVDTPQYPMAFFLKAVVTGELRRAEFEQSVRSACERHPLSRAIVRRSLGRLRWVESEREKLPIDWSMEPGGPPLCPDHLNLNREPGIRIWVRPAGERTEITFEFHHACCDGIGATQFIGDILAFYGQQTAEPDAEQPRLHDLSTELLFRRGEIFERSKDQPKQKRSVVKVIHKFRRLVGRKTMLLAAPGEPPSHSIDRSSFLTEILERSVFRGLRNLAKQTGTSLNDVLLREMFLTLRDWNVQHQALIESEWLRIGMPINMRPPKFDGLPSCNMVSFMFLPRQPDFCNDEEKLLESISEQTTRTLNQRLGNWSLSVLKLMRKVPGLLPLLLNRRDPFATSILANVGEMHKNFSAAFPMHRGKCIAGNIVLDWLGGVAPVREGTRLAVTACIYANELSINMNCDQHLYSHDEARALLDLFCERLKSRASHA